MTDPFSDGSLAVMLYTHRPDRAASPILRVSTAYPYWRRYRGLRALADTKRVLDGVLHAGTVSKASPIGLSACFMLPNGSRRWLARTSRLHSNEIAQGIQQYIRRSTCSIA